MGKYIDITGKKFGRLTPQWPAGRKGRAVHWLCLCECGSMIVVAYGHIGKEVFSCGCFRRDRASKLTPKTYESATAVLRQLYHLYKYGAKKRNLCFELTADKFKILVFSNCFYCGEKPNRIHKHHEGSIICNGVDRKQNKIGYTEENCVPCCKQCNLTKLDFSAEEYIEKCKKVADYVHKRLLV